MASTREDIKTPEDVRRLLVDHVAHCAAEYAASFETDSAQRAHLFRDLLAAVEALRRLIDEQEITLDTLSRHHIYGFGAKRIEMTDPDRKEGEDAPAPAR